MPDSPFGAPSGEQLKKMKMQHPSFQSFVSNTPIAGWNFDPRLALYVDPNMPANLYPHFVTANMPTVKGLSTVQIPVGAGSHIDPAFLAMVQGTQGFTPEGQQQIQQASQQPSGVSPDPFGGWGAEVTGPTSRPNEPVTTGLPFGAGASFVQMPGEDETRFKSRVVQALLDSPNSNAATKAFAARMAAEVGYAPQVAPSNGLFQQQHPGLGFYDPGMSGPNDNTLPTSGANGQRTTGFAIQNTPTGGTMESMPSPAEWQRLHPGQPQPPSRGTIGIPGTG